MFLIGPCFIRVLLFLGAVCPALRAWPEVHSVGLLGEAFSASCSPRRHGARVVVTMWESKVESRNGHLKQKEIYKGKLE